jgi:hypothetical protein
VRRLKPELKRDLARRLQCIRGEFLAREAKHGAGFQRRGHATLGPDETDAEETRKIETGTAQSRVNSAAQEALKERWQSR